MEEFSDRPQPESKDTSTKPTSAWKILSWVTFVLLMITAPMICEELRNGAVLREGTLAKARVVAIKPTGNSYNDDQEVQIDLEVQPDQGEPYRAKAQTYLHPVHFPRYQPGAMVDVRFAPEKPSRVAVVPP